MQEQQNSGQVLRENLDKLHTTPLGVERIKRNLGLTENDVVSWCKQRILCPDSVIEHRGKNWYAAIDGCVITVNAHSYTIITAHKNKKANTGNCN